MKIREFSLNTTDFGIILLARALPVGGDPWGELAPLRGTEWEKLIPIVTGEELSEALHGHARPLVQKLGPEPRITLRRVPEPRRCAEFKDCITRAEKNCHPSPKVPECFVPSGLDADARFIGNYVVRAWKGGRYVVVVEGAEFSL